MKLMFSHLTPEADFTEWLNANRDAHVSEVIGDIILNYCAALKTVRELQGLACTAVCQARDLANGWPEGQLCQPIADTFATLDRLVPGHDVERP